MKTESVGSILRYWLKENGYDGLVNCETDGCGCSIDDFAPGECLHETCEPAHHYKCCKCGEDWFCSHIKKPEEVVCDECGGNDY